MTTADTPTLEITVRGEVVASNADVFRAEWQAILAEINRNPSTDSEFAEAEEHVKRLADAEAATKAAKEGALKECEQLYSLLSTLDETCEEIRAARLQLSNAIESKKAAIKDDLVNDAIEEIELPPLRGRTAFLATLQNAIKGKRTMESIRQALAFAVDLINSTLKANREHLEEFEAGYGTAMTHDRENLLTMGSQAMRAELQKRFEVQSARDEAAKAKKEADELREAAKRQGPEPEPQRVNSPIPDPVSANTPTPAPSLTLDQKAEMAGFIAAVRAAAGPIKEARLLLKNPANMAKAQAFADGLNSLYKTLIA
jgi:hypothetical protein